MIICYIPITNVIAISLDDDRDKTSNICILDIDIQHIIDTLTDIEAQVVSVQIIHANVQSISIQLSSIDRVSIYNSSIGLLKTAYKLDCLFLEHVHISTMMLERINNIYIDDTVIKDCYIKGGIKHFQIFDGYECESYIRYISCLYIDKLTISTTTNTVITTLNSFVKTWRIYRNKVPCLSSPSLHSTYVALMIGGNLVRLDEIKHPDFLHYIINHTI